MRRFEMMPLTGAARGFAQRIDLLGQKSTPTIKKIGREEPASSRYKRTAIVGHPEKLSE
jgi:hypothetical protein